RTDGRIGEAYGRTNDEKIRFVNGKTETFDGRRAGTCGNVPRCTVYERRKTVSPLFWQVFANQQRRRRFYDEAWKAYGEYVWRRPGRSGFQPGGYRPRPLSYWAVRQ